MITLENISKAYGKKQFFALNKINLHVNEGEMVAIMGPSGSGKSTLLNIIGFIDKPTDGKYFFDGKDTGEMKNKLSKLRNREVGFVFQHFALINEYNVVDNVILPLIYRRMSHKKRVEKAKEMLEMVGLENHFNKNINELSGGEQQRVAIARTLAQEPSVILADEPTGALDQKNGDNIMRILKEVNKNGKTILIVTHDEKVSGYCDRTIKLLDGCVK